MAKRLSEEEFGEKEAKEVLKTCMESVVDVRYEVFNAVANCIEILVNYAESELKTLIPKLLLIISLRDNLLINVAKKLLMLIKENYGTEYLIEQLASCLDKSFIETVRLESLKLLSEHRQDILQKETLKICITAAHELQHKHTEASKVLQILTSNIAKAEQLLPQTLKLHNSIKEKLRIKLDSSTIKELIADELVHTCEEVSAQLRVIVNEVRTTVIDFDVMSSIVQFIFNNSIYGTEEGLQKNGFDALLEIVEVLGVRLENCLGDIVINLIRCYIFPKKAWNAIDEVLKTLARIFTPTKIAAILIPTFKIFRSPMLQNSLKALSVIIKTIAVHELASVIQLLSEDLIDAINNEEVEVRKEGMRCIAEISKISKEIFERYFSLTPSQLSLIRIYSACVV
eukprot:TRINITY_DN5754_c0_g2_i1.p1 TRINITY_DN5754_c0_g2~~TRINITY_DN5754_c0_g2_i1.p1  ORF type:complete len:399 (-),score=56.35 TRINITY_DN5754_c0_g2_i1:81-1277(-)